MDLTTRVLVCIWQVSSERLLQNSTNCSLTLFSLKKASTTTEKEMLYMSINLQLVPNLHQWFMMRYLPASNKLINSHAEERQWILFVNYMDNQHGPDWESLHLTWGQEHNFCFHHLHTTADFFQLKWKILVFIAQHPTGNTKNRDWMECSNY